MKNTKVMMILVLAGTVTFTVGLWIYSTMDTLGLFEYAIMAVVFIIVACSVVIGIKRIKDAKKGLAVEDELSHRIKQKAAANAFIYSIYMWTMIIIFTGDTLIRSSILLGIGILGMGLLFMGFWYYYSRQGVEDENPN